MAEKNGKISAQDRKTLRRQRRQEANRREILEASERVFVTKGYHKATIEEIAEEAGFATGTLYNFFSSKQDLYEKVIEDLLDEFQEEFDTRVLTLENPREAIHEAIRLRFEHFQKHQGFLRVFFEVSPAGRLDVEHGLPDHCKDRTEYFVEQIQAVFQKGIEMEIFDDMDPLYLTLCLEGIMNACISYWSTHEIEMPMEERIEKLQQSFLDRISIKLSRQTKQ